MLTLSVALTLLVASQADAKELKITEVSVSSTAGSVSGLAVVPAQALRSTREHRAFGKSIRMRFSLLH